MSVSSTVDAHWYQACFNMLLVDRKVCKALDSNSIKVISKALDSNSKVISNQLDSINIKNICNSSR